MNKDWKLIYKELEELLREYRVPYFEYNKGKNKKIKESGKYQVDNIITRMQHIINNDKDIWGMIVNEQFNVGGAELLAEFKHADKFEESLKSLLARIKDEKLSDDKETEK